MNGRKGSTVTCAVEEDKFLEFWKRRATGTKDFKARDEARRYGARIFDIIDVEEVLDKLPRRKRQDWME